MAAFDGNINFSSSEHRPCEVNGRKAVFHRWDFIQKPIGAEAHIGGAPAGQLSYTLGIVEYEDGTLAEAYPINIKFTDGFASEIIREYCEEGKE